MDCTIDNIPTGGGWKGSLAAPSERVRSESGNCLVATGPLSEELADDAPPPADNPTRESLDQFNLLVREPKLPEVVSEPWVRLKGLTLRPQFIDDPDHPPGTVRRR